MEERCTICNCILHRTAGTYARPTPEGRSHATKHHYVAERFFGRSSNRKGTKHQGIFDSCPWGHEGETAVFCYECHEELVHNPVFMPDDLTAFSEIVKYRGLDEESKSDDRTKLGSRIKLLHEVIQKGLKVVSSESS